MLGNIFFNGTYSNHYLEFDNSYSKANIYGNYSNEIFSNIKYIRSNIIKNFLKLGFFYVPTSLKMSTPGSDSHYSGTVNISHKKILGNCDKECKIYGLNNVYVVDGAVLNYLSEKSHTLTLMANAMRVTSNSIKNNYL